MRAQVVSFHCILKSQVGNQILSSTFNQDVITHVEGAPEGGLMLPGLAEGLQDLRKGEKRTIFVPAQQAYGFYQPALVRECPRDEISDGAYLQVGHQVLMQLDGRQRLCRVVQVNGASVTLDANHPLAGMDLVFDIEATEARDATSEEIEESKVGGDEGRPLLH